MYPARAATNDKMDKQEKIIECLRKYPRATKEEREKVTNIVLASIADAGIGGHIGFDVRGKYETAITFESEVEIPESKTTELKRILAQRFGKDDIRIGVRKDTTYTVRFNPHRPDLTEGGYYEDVWNLIINIPHDTPEVLGLREVMTEFEYTHNPAILPIPIGSHMFGEPLVVDLTRLPHMLIAGNPGMGKTNILNTFIISLLYSKSPDELRFVLIVPERNSFETYKPLTGSYINAIITDSTEAIRTLEELNSEMNHRYDTFRNAGCKDIVEYNSQSISQLPYIAVMVDEFSLFGADFEQAICRLAQLSRTTGIHIVMTTSQLTEDVITPRTKANFPSRIALKTDTSEASELILDEDGAEDLEVPGDLLFPYQGCTYNLLHSLVTPDEINNVVSELAV